MHLLLYVVLLYPFLPSNNLAPFYIQVNPGAHQLDSITLSYSLAAHFELLRKQNNFLSTYSLRLRDELHHTDISFLHHIAFLRAQCHLLNSHREELLEELDKIELIVDSVNQDEQ
jgi:hypothetical protein